MGPEKSPEQSLAEYDARAVSDKTLCEIFSCAPADLAEARLTDEYKRFLAIESATSEGRARTIDDAWDLIEEHATAGLLDVAEATADPRVLTHIAQTANRATRKKAGGASADRAAEGSTIKVGIDNRTVVVLRTNFLSVLQDSDKVAEMQERQAAALSEIKQDVNEEMTPNEATGVIGRALKIDMNARPTHHRTGPDLIDMSALELEFDEADLKLGDPQ